MRQRLILSNTTAAALIMAAGCASTPDAEPMRIADAPPRAYEPPKTWDPGSRPVASQMLSARQPTGAETQLLATQRLSGARSDLNSIEPGTVDPRAAQIIPVQGSWRAVDVTDLLHVLFKEYLERDYVLDPAIQGQVTVELDGEYTRSDLMDVVGGIASCFNWAIEDRAGVLHVRPGVRSAKMATTPILQSMPAGATDMASVRVRRLRYVAPEQLATMLGNFATEGAVIAHSGKTLVMADTTRQIGRLSRLVASLDVPVFEGTEIWTYRLAHRLPLEISDTLQSLAQSSGLVSGAEPLVAFVPVPGTRRIMVVAKDASLHPQVGDLIRELDQPANSDIRNNYIYRAQHLPAADLYSQISGFLSDRIEGMPGVGGRPDPDYAPIRIQAPTPNGDFMLVKASPDDWVEIYEMLREMDRAPQQVKIESLVMEVRLSNRLEFGVEYFLELGDLSLIGAAPITGAATGSAFLVGSDGFAVFQALDAESDAKILSSPYFFVQDRAIGSFQVGGEVPVLRASEGSETQTGGTSAIREEIEYRETGVILTIQADINESGQVKLAITQEIRDTIPTDIANQPEFTTRSIETTVTVQHGQTVLLGGIINEAESDQRNRIPLLGRVPVVGAAFSQTLKRTERSEIVLAITPTIINEPDQAVSNLGEFMRGAAAVRAALHSFAEQLPVGALYEQPEVGAESPEPEASIQPGATILPDSSPVPPTSLDREELLMWTLDLLRSLTPEERSFVTDGLTITDPAAAGGRRR